MNLKKLLLTANECYIVGKALKVQGVMVHSTGANNPTLKRYVGPDDGLLGQNQYNNHWNQFRPGNRQVCVHGFIGKLADGSIATYQTLPWDMRGWHGASGAKGSVNNTHIGFEICEDDLSSATYFNAVYKEAVELVAYLCTLFNLNPLADGVVICHSEGYQRGIASNHGDVMHWFPKHGKNMNMFRADVATLMNQQAQPSIDAEMEQIARVVAAESRGEPYEGQIAVAQCIWDRLNDSKKRFGKDLTDVLRPGQFASPWNGDLKTVKCLQATEDVFKNGKRAFNQPVYFFLSKGASQATFDQRNATYIYLGEIAGHKFWGDVKTATPTPDPMPPAFSPYIIKINNVNVRKDATTSSALVGTTGVGSFTIVEEKNGWGKLKSGMGWVKLDWSDKPRTSIEVGDLVNFSGGTHYTSSTGTKGYAVKAGPAKVTAKNPGSKHPYHLISTNTKLTSVYGWVDANTVSKS